MKNGVDIKKMDIHEKRCNTYMTYISDDISTGLQEKITQITELFSIWN